MAYTTTPAEVYAAARRRADQVNSDFRDDTAIAKLVDKVWAEVLEHILTAQPERSIKKQAFDAVAGTDTYTLDDVVDDADVWKVKDLFTTVNGRKRRVAPFQWEQFARLQNTTSGRPWANPFFWRIVGGDLVIEPAPTTTYPLELWYHPLPIKWSDLNSDDDIEVYCGWDEALIVGVAWKLALEEGDTEVADRLNAEYLRQLQRILEFGAVRVTEAVEYARDVYSYDADEDDC